MPHKPSNSELAEKLPAHKCPSCSWQICGVDDWGEFSPCPRCLEPSYGSLAEAAAAIQERQRKPGEKFISILPQEVAQRIQAAERDEQSRYLAELDKLLPLEENPAKQKRLAWETRTYASTTMLAKPLWNIPPPVDKLLATPTPMPEPVEMCIIDRLTGEVYREPRFTDNGVICKLGGEEYFLPAGSYDTELDKNS